MRRVFRLPAGPERVASLVLRALVSGLGRSASPRSFYACLSAGWAVARCFARYARARQPAGPERKCTRVCHQRVPERKRLARGRDNGARAGHKTLGRRRGWRLITGNLDFRLLFYFGVHGRNIFSASKHLSFSRFCTTRSLPASGFVCSEIPSKLPASASFSDGVGLPRSA